MLNDYRLTEPDIALLKPSGSFYADRHPQADDALLVVEVSRSNLLYDKTEKLPRYAEAGIAEVWIIDVDAELLEVHREPVSGRYRVRLLLGLNEDVTP